MTTTLSAPAPAAAHSAGCPVERRALRSGARDLAAALTGIAFDAPCCPRRQRALAACSAGVRTTVRAVGDRDEDLPLLAACGTVAAAEPLFAADVSAGAPVLARAWSTVADLLGGDPAGSHDHAPGDLLRCARRFRSAAGSALVAVPWFLDACSPRERVEVVMAAPRRLRLALRLGEDRWLARRDAVRATSPAGAH
ncbi:hypothetical protein ACI79C_05775 [Geodermatophilus sp. SYSU D00697]